MSPPITPTMRPQEIAVMVAQAALTHEAFPNRLREDTSFDWGRSVIATEQTGEMAVVAISYPSGWPESPYMVTCVLERIRSLWIPRRCQIVYPDRWGTKRQRFLVRVDSQSQLKLDPTPEED
jgi:hypothetical protein